MNIEIELQPKYYRAVEKKEKIIEIRLLDEKRRKLKTGDKITFYNADNVNSRLDVEITELIRRDSFSELLESAHLSDFGLVHKENVANLLAELHKYYPEVREKELGVLGIRFKVID